MQDVPTISRFELKKLIDAKRPFTLVETLAADRFAQGHLPGAVNLPPDQLEQLAPTMLPEKNAEIVLYCSSPT
ncbi:MAG TPA: rhodanese-like domain-containing protein [Terriglobales bacterium]|nr:rhodanese-like domain-containing protein [Terriglobales bacterium]